MVQSSVRPAREIELEMNLDDARLTPLFCRLATAYWRIVQTRADEVAFPILRARISVDVDSDGVTWFPFSVHSDATHDEAWAFQRSIGPDAQRWIDQLEPGERKARELVSLLIVGLRERRGAASSSSRTLLARSPSWAAVPPPWSARRPSEPRLSRPYCAADASTGRARVRAVTWKAHQRRHNPLIRRPR